MQACWGISKDFKGYALAVFYGKSEIVLFFFVVSKEDDE